MYNPGEALATAVNSLKAGKVHLIDKKVYEFKLKDHFLHLSNDDRRLRFGANLPDERIFHYVDDQIKEGDYVFAVFDDLGDIVAVLHMASHGKDKSAYEFGLSVREDYRMHGYANKLFKKGITHAKALGAKRIYTYCLSENKVMQHLARKNELKVMLEYGDVTGELALEPRNNVEIVNNLVEFATTENLMIFDRMSERYVTTLLEQYRAFETMAKNTFANSFFTPK